MLFQVYKDNRHWVSINRRRYWESNMLCGMKLGCPLSTTLFVCIFDVVVVRLQSLVGPQSAFGAVADDLGDGEFCGGKCAPPITHHPLRPPRIRASARPGVASTATPYSKSRNKRRLARSTIPPPPFGPREEPTATNCLFSQTDCDNFHGAMRFKYQHHVVATHEKT